MTAGQDLAAGENAVLVMANSKHYRQGMAVCVDRFVEQCHALPNNTKTVPLCAIKFLVVHEGDQASSIGDQTISCALNKWEGLSAVDSTHIGRLQSI